MSETIDELIEKIEEYDLYDDDIISSICDFYDTRGYMTEKQENVLVDQIDQYEEAGGESYFDQYEQLKMD